MITKAPDDIDSERGARVLLPYYRVPLAFTAARFSASLALRMALEMAFIHRSHSRAEDAFSCIDSPPRG